jgi:magnesium-transporting ATPase (P-type)
LNQVLAAAALRVLALAYRDLPDGHGAEDADAANDLVFVGLVGMTDPLRDEAKAAIATCREAGIRSVMITGDQQITALNMITDIFPALALALEPSAPGMMSRPPHDPKAPLLSGRLLLMIGWQGVLLAAVTLLAFFIGMQIYGAEGEGLKHAITVAFMTLALVQVVHVFSSRSETRSAFGGRLFKNGWLWGAVVLCLLLQVAAVYVPFLRAILHTVPLDAIDWGVVAACALFPLAVVEVVKLIQRRLSHGRPLDAHHLGRVSTVVVPGT